MRNWTANDRVIIFNLHRTALLLAVFGVLAWTTSAWTQDKPSGKASDKVILKVVKVDSEETSGEDGKGANAVDGDENTFWHTQWQDGNPGHPHEIVIELSRACKIKGFT